MCFGNYRGRAVGHRSEACFSRASLGHARLGFSQTARHIAVAKSKALVEGVRIVRRKLGA